MKRFILAPVTLVALAAGTAHGQLLDNDEGFYVGAGLGTFSTQLDSFDDVDLDDFDEDESALRVFAGWRFNNFFSVQVDHYDFNEATSASQVLSISADTKGWAPSIVGTLPLGPVELSARAGVLLYDIDINTDDLSVSESENAAVYAVGIGFTVLSRLNLKLEYEVLDISEYDESEAAWISAAWRF